MTSRKLCIYSSSDLRVGVQKSFRTFFKSTSFHSVHITAERQLQPKLKTSVFPIFTCVNLEVHPEVARIAEGLTAVFTLVGFHPHMPHEVNIELSRRNEST